MGTLKKQLSTLHWTWGGLGNIDEQWANSEKKIIKVVIFGPSECQVDALSPAFLSKNRKNLIILQGMNSSQFIDFILTKVCKIFE